VDEVLGTATPIIILVVIVALIVAAAIRLGPGFVIKRMAGLVFVLLGVTFITFILGYLSPASPILLQCGEKCTPPLLAHLQQVYGLDLPWYQQYYNFVFRLLHFDLGLSYKAGGRSVVEILNRGIPVSVQLGVMALITQLLLGIPAGIFAARRAGTRVDTGLMSVSLVTFSLPTFVTIPFFQLITVVLSLNHWPHLPLSGWGTPAQMIAPVGILTLVGFGYYARLTRTTMLDVLGQDYIRTARAKGLTDRTVTIRHAFRNALVPLVTAVGPALAFVVSGAVFTESFFNIPGIGFFAANAILSTDMPIVQGTVVVVATTVVLMNVMVDVIYGLLDPRIKVQ